MPQVSLTSELGAGWAGLGRGDFGGWDRLNESSDLVNVGVVGSKEEMGVELGGEIQLRQEFEVEGKGRELGLLVRNSCPTF